MKNMSYDTSANKLYLQKKDTIQTGSVKINDHYLDGYTDVVLPEIIPKPSAAAPMISITV